VDDLRHKLEKALGMAMVLPERRIRSVAEFVEKFLQVKEIIIDGTERPIRRPKDKKKQKECYSGKNRRHTQKNIFIASSQKEILLLFPTYNGKEHDYVIL
jgi:phage-related protein